MSAFVQRIKDWYVEGPRDFYRRYLQNFWDRMGLVAVSGEHGFLDMDPLPLGYAEVDEDNFAAMRRIYDREIKRAGIRKESN